MSINELLKDFKLLDLSSCGLNEATRDCIKHIAYAIKSKTIEKVRDEKSISLEALWQVLDELE